MHSAVITREVALLLSTLFSLSHAQTGAFFLLTAGSSLVTERIDPNLSPGTPSNYVQVFTGANGLNATEDFDTTQAATCDTFPVKAHKSNYWSPSLYFQDKDGNFTRVPEKGLFKVFYQYAKADGTPDLELKEFPPGFRMISGNSQLRSNDGSIGDSGTQLSWVCGSSQGAITATGFPKGFTDCDTDGLYATIRFPSCWDGQAFEASEPSAHMTFPNSADGLAGCAAPYNFQRLPQLFMETYWDVSSFNGKYDSIEIPWVLSNGDPTGYSYNADFIDGWEIGKLQHAIESCNVGSSDEPLDSDSCFGSGGLYDREQELACKVPSQVDENIGGTLDALPGCNPVQSGPATATTATGCGAPTTLTQPATGAAPPTPTATGAAPPTPTATGAAPTTPTPSPAAPTTLSEAGSSQINPSIL